MSSMEKNLLAAAVNSIDIAVAVMNKYVGMTIPHDVMADIISHEDGLEEELLQYPSFTDSIDTFTRDYLFDAVGLYFVGQYWPMNMSGDDYSKNFYKKLVAAGKKVGVVFPGLENTTVHGGKRALEVA